jgi:hypothetical protein
VPNRLHHLGLFEGGLLDIVDKRGRFGFPAQHPRGNVPGVTATEALGHQNFWLILVLVTMLSNEALSSRILRIMSMTVCTVWLEVFLCKRHKGDTGAKCSIAWRFG